MDKQISIPSSLMISCKHSVGSSPRGFNTSTAFATTAENSGFLPGAPQSAGGPSSDLRQPMFDMNNQSRYSGQIEVPSSLRERRGGSTIKARPSIGNGLVRNVGFNGTSYVDFTQVDVKSNILRKNKNSG